MKKRKSRLHSPASKRRSSAFLAVFLVISVLALSIAVTYTGWHLFKQHKATNNPNPVINTTVVTHSTESPDETKPTEACAAYKAPSANPERLAIPSLSVEGCIESVGIDQHGAVAVPTNIHIAGWFTDSAKPGEPGLSIIDGHINGNFTNDGIFQHLDKLAVGATFTVKKGDGTVLNYEAMEVKSVPLDEAGKVLFTHNTAIASQLNLITCGGQWYAELNQFDRRIIVIAKLVQ